MALRTPEVSIGVGLAVGTVVYGIYQGALPPVADVRSLDAHNQDVAASERMAGWTAAAVVAGISLLAKDGTVFIIGGSMVIAMSLRHRHANAVNPVEGRAGTEGRGLPEGLRYVDSWVEPNFDRCFQVMECDDAALLQQWVLHWAGLADFEIIPVVKSADTRAVVEPLL